METNKTNVNHVKITHIYLIIFAKFLVQINIKTTIYNGSVINVKTATVRTVKPILKFASSV